MSHSYRRTLIFAAAAVMLAGVVGTASAETTWQKNHPRRTQVNHRLHKQNRRIHNDVKNGTLSKGQAASLNGGHITKPEQKALNGQESAISSQIPPQ